MTTTTHTPTPWSTFGSIIKAGLTTVALAELKPNEYYDNALAEANAAFIVEACNAHAANIAHIAELESALKNIVEFDSMDYSEHIRGMQKLARAALAKVQQ